MPVPNNKDKAWTGTYLEGRTIPKFQMFVPIRRSTQPRNFYSLSLSLSRYRLPRSDHFSLSSCQISLQLVRAEPLRTGPEYFSSGMNSPPTGQCHSSGFVPGTVKPGRKVHVRCSYRASITRANFERNNVSVPARYNSRSVAAAAVVVRCVHA